jgi:hypothetical protein
LLEKLSSSLLDTKSEVLASFRFAFTDMSVRHGKQHIWPFEEMDGLLRTISSQLTTEIMQSTDPSIPSSALDVITDMTRYIASAYVLFVHVSISFATEMRRLTSGSFAQRRGRETGATPQSFD